MKLGSKRISIKLNANENAKVQKFAQMVGHSAETVTKMGLFSLINQTANELRKLRTEQATQPVTQPAGDKTDASRTSESTEITSGA